MKELWAHFDAETGEKQRLEQHLTQVSEQMLRDLDAVFFDLTENVEECLQEIGMKHDLGKATMFFQEYLLKQAAASPMSRHSMISAALLAASQEEISLAVFLQWIAVKCHHGELNTAVPLACDNIWQDVQEQFASCQKQLKGSSLEQLLPTALDTDSLYKRLRKASKMLRKNETQQPFFLMQLLFSKLISADKLDSADLLRLSKTTLAGDVEAVLAKKRVGSTVDLNSSRERIRNTVLAQIAGMTAEQVRQERLFTITAPTGTGKTLTGLSAALALAEKLEQTEGWRPHIISAVPFINILEQSKADYQEVFCGGSEMIVHYGASDPAELKRANREELPLKDKMLLMSSWEAPVIMTTFVQLFESILTGKNGRMLKLNRLVGAIVILDEVQALNSEYYPLFAIVMDSAAKYYGTRFILMTATQPKIFSCTTALHYPVPCFRELLPEHSTYFHALHRTKLVPRWDELDSIEAVADAIEAAQQQFDSILCVVNTIKSSIELFAMLRERDISVLYLSTNLISKDRKAVIARAKQQLVAHEGFVMVSTQAIEAGVDLDFDAAFRDLAPMESVIQAAGRVNRSGTKAEYAPIFLFDTHSSQYVYNSIACKLVKETISTVITESEYEQMLTVYFDKMLTNGTSFDTRIYKDGILKLDYEVINEFHMIQAQNKETVLVLKDVEIIEKVDLLCALIHEKTEQGQYERKAEIKRLMNQIEAYTVEIFTEKLVKNLPATFKDIYNIDLNYYVASEDDWQRYYDIETGFITEAGTLMF